MKSYISHSIYKRFDYTVLRTLSTATTAPNSTTQKKVESDKRYQAVNEVPQHVLESMHKDVIHSPGFSIKGQIYNLLYFVAYI